MHSTTGQSKLEEVRRENEEQRKKQKGEDKGRKREKEGLEVRVRQSDEVERKITQMLLIMLLCILF